MKAALLNLGYAPIQYEFNGIACVGVILPISRRPTALNEILLAVNHPEINNHQSITIGKDLLVFWPTVIY